MRETKPLTLRFLEAESGVHVETLFPRPVLSAGGEPMSSAIPSFLLFFFFLCFLALWLSSASLEWAATAASCEATALCFFFVLRGNDIVLVSGVSAATRLLSSSEPRRSVVRMCLIVALSSNIVFFFLVPWAASILFFLFGAGSFADSSRQTARFALVEGKSEILWSKDDATPCENAGRWSSNACLADRTFFLGAAPSSFISP